MQLWKVAFQTLRPMASLPRLTHVARERRGDAAYHYQGRFRQSEKHCLFEYTLAGRGVFRDGETEYPVLPGSGFLCEINDPATAYYYPPDGQESWEFLFICIEGEMAHQIVRELVCRHGRIYSLPPATGIITHFQSWQRFDSTQVRLTPAQSARAAMDLLTALADSKQPAPSEADNIALRAQELVRHNLDRNLNVSDLARMLGVCREHLTRQFKEQTSQTPYQFILREKMLQACHMLKETTLTSKQIAARLGYDQPAHFTRTFKSALRMTPSDFRRNGVVPIR